MAQRGTSLQALALLLFGIIVALALLVIVGQSLARLAYTASDDFPVLRALGSSRGQLAAVALAPGALIAAAGMALAIPAAYALSVFTPVGLARRAEISPGLSFDAPILLGGAVLLALLLTARAALAAQRVARTQADATAGSRGRGSRLARWMARRGFPAVTGIRLAFAPGTDRTAVPVRSAVLGTALALGAAWPRSCSGPAWPTSSATPGWPAGTGTWPWGTRTRVTPPPRPSRSCARTPAWRVSPPRPWGTGTSAARTCRSSGSRRCAATSRRRCWTASCPAGHGRSPSAAGNSAPCTRSVGGLVSARATRGLVALRITGQVVLSPEITNEQVKLGSGGVMTLAGAGTLSRTPLPVNVYLVRLRHPG